MTMEQRLSYEYLITQFGEDVIQKRHDYMEKRALKFIEESGLEGTVILNHLMLHAVILDYFTDIHRLKIFANISHSNKNKITAYMSYWWMRRKPLQVIVDTMDNEDLVYINEKFVAVLLSKDFMYENREKLLSNEQCNTCLQHIYYHLKYRAYTAQTLELMLMAADTGIEIGKVNNVLSDT